jgi:hypothetical protein
MSKIQWQQTRCLAMLFLLLVPVLVRAQPAARKGAAPAALLAYSGFYHGQAIVTRGVLSTRGDQPILISESIDRTIPLVLTGPSPIDGPVEIRATFWDIGRLHRDDPRIAALGVDRLLRQDAEGDWPRPGELVALVVTDAMTVRAPDAEPTLREIALDPTAHVGKRVKVKGQFRGKNLYGDLPQGPGLSQWDFVLRAADSALWVAGLRPRGKGFNLNPGARVDTGNWLEVSGVLREKNGLIWIEAQQLALTKPDVELKNAETPPAQLLGPPPEVIFSDPADGDSDVPLKATVRLQFSRDMNPDSFKSNVRWSFGPADAVSATAGTAPPRPADVKYDRAKRALEVSLDLNDAAAYRTVTVELLDGIAATDGAKLKPWRMVFSFGGK